MNSVHSKILIGVLAIMVVAFPVCSQEAAISLEDEIKNLLEDFPAKTQLSIAIIDGKDISYHSILKNAEGQTHSDDSQHIYEIGSISKVFTSLMLAQQVEQGAISLDDKVTDFFDVEWNESEKDGVSITLTHLANHTSGLPRLPTNALKGADMMDPYAHYVQADLLSYLQNDVKIATKPGEKYAYSNLAAGMLGDLMAAEKEMSYEEYLRQYITEPLGMNSTFVNLPDEIKGRLVSPLQANGDVGKGWHFKIMAGLGGIRSSIEDMAIFTSSYLKPDGARTLQMVSTFDFNATAGVALGLHYNEKDGKRVYWHNGGTGGYKSCLAIHPENNQAVVILSNVSAFHKGAAKIDQACFAILEKWVGK